MKLQEINEPVLENKAKKKKKEKKETKPIKKHMEND